MLFIASVILLAIAGTIIGIVGGYFFGGPYGLMSGFFSSFMVFMSVFMLIGKAKNKGFLVMYRDLKRNMKEGWYEKFVHVPNKYGRFHTFVGKVKEKGLVKIKGIGTLDDKGDEYTWGIDPASFALLNAGITLDFKAALYTNKLESGENLADYESGLRKFLGPELYPKFLKKHSKTKPDITDINNEFDDVVHTKPVDSLEKNIVGETVGFKHFVQWLKYVANPINIEGSILSERLYIKQLERQMQDPNAKYSGWSKLIFTIILAVMIFIIVLGSMWESISPMFSGIFGGG